MDVRLSQYGDTFASRDRGRRLADELGSLDRIDVLKLDFTDVYASPSFLSELLRHLDSRVQRICIVGAREHIAGIARRTAERQGLGDRVTVEEIIAA